MHRFGRVFVILVLVMCSLLAVEAQETDTSQSEMRPMIQRYAADRASLMRSSPIAFSPARHARMKQFYDDWLTRIDGANFDTMGQDGRIDYLLFRNQLDYELRQLD